MFLKAKNTGFVALSVFLRDSFAAPPWACRVRRRRSKNLAPVAILAACRGSCGGPCAWRISS